MKKKKSLVMNISTNWYVITGAPSSGKTTVIKHLASLGYKTLSESARDLIDTGINKGKTINEVRADEAEFQKRILQMKIEAENKISPEQLVFIDGGGIPSSIAYYRIAGLDPAPAIEESKKRKYRGIFFFERLPLEKDYARKEDEKTVSDLDRLLYNAYLTLGYNVVPVSVMPVKERVKFILNKINH